MFGLYRQFTLGRYTKAFIIKASGEASSKNNLKALIKEAFRKDLIDGIIGTSLNKKEGFVSPVFIKCEKEVEKFEPFFFIHGGQNSLLKKITQKYSFEKLGVAGHSCVLDGINKMQYFGIGSNFTVTKFTLKIGIACIGAISLEGIKCLLKEKKVKNPGFNEIFLENNKIILKNKYEKFDFSAKEYYYYLNEGCKVCMNLSSRGSDITFVPSLRNGYSLVLVRSAKALKLFENPGFSVKKAEKSDIEEFESLAKNFLKKNIETILERAEFGIPSNKWDGNRFGRFTALWNNIYAENIEEEVF